MDKLVSDLLQGSRRAAARLITIIENDDPSRIKLLQQIYPHGGGAFVIGITGSPGSGKSSLVDRLLRLIRADKMSVGIIAVDPTSPFSGGAILGDRIRMQDHALDADVFIRSMGTRGSLGGLSRSTGEAIQVLDALGKDLIIVETVGVGQSEVDIVKTADTTIVVLTPAGGDSVQTIKAGIMEIADIFAVNKADLPGVERTVAELNAMLDMKPDCSHRPPVIKTISTDSSGVDALWEAIRGHRLYLEESGGLAGIRRERVRRELADQVEHLVKNRVWERVRSELSFDDLVEEIAARKRDPYSTAVSILAGIGIERGQ